MARKKTIPSNIADWQAKRVEKRSRFIKEAVKQAKKMRFDSYNAFATYLATRLTEYEKLEAEHQHELSGSKKTFKPPKPVSRQIFFKNQIYRAIAESAYTGRIIEGTMSIVNPRTQSEFKTVLLQKDFEISNLKADIERLIVQIKEATTTPSKSHSNNSKSGDCDDLRKEKALSTQVIIKLLKWSESLLKFEDGEIIDLGARGKKRIVVSKTMLKHCANALDKGLNGFKDDE